MKTEAQKKIDLKKKEQKILTGQNIENGLNYQATPAINEQIKPTGTAILG